MNKGTLHRSSVVMPNSLLLCCLLCQVLEGSTDPSAAPDIAAAGAAALAAASGVGRRGGLSPLAIKGTMLGLRVGDEVQLRGSWIHSDRYGWQVRWVGGWAIDG